MASALRVQVSPSAWIKPLNSISTITTTEPGLIVVFISNGPGELTTWVKPLAEDLHRSLSIRPYEPNAFISLSLVLVPCPNATGNEKEVATSWKLFDKVTAAKDFWSVLINPKKFGYWPPKGIVVFLGGDQFWSVLLSARLKYKNITYAEWIARWPFWNDRIAAMSPKVKQRLPKKLKQRCVVVGDLMADIKKESKNSAPLPQGKWVAILPGSKKAKLSIGIPFFLEVADLLSQKNQDYNFLIPLAPTTNIEEIYYFSSPKNAIAREYNSKVKQIELPNKLCPWKILVTESGTKLHLIEKHPAYDFISQCELAITTIGANTSELGSLGIPMIVVVPTQHLNVMEAWDGFLGILARLPILKYFLGLLIGLWRMRRKKFMAWPNIAANRMIVPERIGKITPKDIANEANEWLNSPRRLQGQREDLRSLRGKAGAIKLMAKEIINLISMVN